MHGANAHLVEFLLLVRLSCTLVRWLMTHMGQTKHHCVAFLLIIETGLNSEAFFFQEAGSSW